MVFLKDTIAERLGGRKFGDETEIYKFEKIKRIRQIAEKEHSNIPLIDMWIGEPDRPAHSNVVRILAQEAGKPENRWYTDRYVRKDLDLEKDKIMTEFNKSNYGDDTMRRYKDNKDNKPDTLGNQLGALKKIGFKEVDCFYKYGIFTMYGGKK
ncbi:MAG: hypothetical protein HY035_09030 [Nitrospirae bacterium]|nr:hypothetical protein [Nitrospirota bacterium]MBI3378523.1 hypothetical protein [Nitrospirota bacterium]